MKVTFKAQHVSSPYARVGAWDLDNVPADDMEGIMEFLELMHEENNDDGLVWKVRAGVISASDGEGMFYCIVPVIA